MCMIWMQKRKTKTPKSTKKIITKSTTKHKLKQNFILENKSRYVINKIYQ